ncbi:HD domain-containing protein [Spongiactinospora gelatinilytica]|uniref:HD domain-containing protein n=1 Tax=Spongiactinospora gelatinilytica TaxID=2666298 RepID=UPI001F287ADD|nr:HD domain-containing protein [Spongiactinospora gelatinilytica]
MRAPLRTAATVKAVSLTILLANLLTFHLKIVANVAVPVHGMAYVTESSPLRWRRPPACAGVPSFLARAACSPSGISAPHRTDDPMDHDSLSFPRTDLALSAMRHARDIEHPAIFDHSVRSYLYGRFIGEEQGLRPDLDYDDELLFLGCVLHDTGLSDEGDNEHTFDIDGADLAARFLADRGVPDQRVEIVWDAVALHLHPDIALRKRPEIALVSAGAGFDLGPHGPTSFPPATPNASTRRSPACTRRPRCTTRSSARRSPSRTRHRRSPCPAS